MTNVELSWRAMARRLPTMTEGELKTLLDAEVIGQRRVFVAERLHQRYSMVRASRERRELMEKLHENPLPVSDTKPGRTGRPRTRRGPQGVAGGADGA